MQVSDSEFIAALCNRLRLANKELDERNKAVHVLTDKVRHTWELLCDRLCRLSLIGRVSMCSPHHGIYAREWQLLWASAWLLLQE